MSEIRGPRSDARGPQDRIDLAIDRAVREMLDVEPREDLRDRVIARLPAPNSQLPASGVRLPAFGWTLGSLAAAAIILLAVFVARHNEPVPAQASVVAAAPERPVAPEGLPPAVPAAPQQAAPRSAVTVPAEAHAAAARTVGAAAYRDADSAVAAIEPLSRIAPIAMPPIVHEEIAPAEIAVRPLNAISEVQIAPMTPPDRR
jgi:hypothetical protein